MENAAWIFVAFIAGAGAGGLTTWRILAGRLRGRSVPEAVPTPAPAAAPAAAPVEAVDPELETVRHATHGVLSELEQRYSQRRAVGDDAEPAPTAPKRPGRRRGGGAA